MGLKPLSRPVLLPKLTHQNRSESHFGSIAGHVKGGKRIQIQPESSTLILVASKDGDIYVAQILIRMRRHVDLGRLSLLASRVA